MNAVQIMWIADGVLFGLLIVGLAAYVAYRRHKNKER